MRAEHRRRWTALLVFMGAMAAPVVAAAVLMLTAAPALAGSPSLTLTAAQPRITCGDQVRLRGAVTVDGWAPVPGVPVAVLAKAAGAEAGTLLGWAVADGEGRFSLGVRPETTTAYIAQWQAPDGPVSSSEVLVEVRTAIRLRGIKRVWKGKLARVRGTVWPARPAGTLVTLLRRSRGDWVAWRQVPLDEQSCFAVTWTPARKGRLRLLASLPADGYNVAGWSHSAVWRIRDRNPHRVPARYRRLVVIDHSEFRLYFYRHGSWVRRFNCVLGKWSTPTPYGRFRIARKRPHPGGANGAYYLGYLGAIGIHGTNQPRLLRHFPRAYSHGCCRLSNRDITWLYRRVPIGTPVWNVL